MTIIDYIIKFVEFQVKIMKNILFYDIVYNGDDNMNSNIKFIIVGIVMIIGFSILGYYELIVKPNKHEENPIVEKKDDEDKDNNQTEDPSITTKLNVNEFDYKLIKEVNANYTDNYLISPMSIGYALSILKEGASNKTKSQLSVLLNNYKVDETYSIKNRIGIANTLFIREENRKYISDNYITKIQNNYNSDLLIDEFKTPKVINDWISEKTFNMINNTIKSLSSEFTLGIANAIAIDVEWKNKFECTSTREKEFTLSNGKKINTPMMSSSNDAYYIESNLAKGIIKDYKIYNKNTGDEVTQEDENTVALEYIAILPNNDIREYIGNFNNNELNRLLNSKKEANETTDINYSIPRYTYDFNYDKFPNSLRLLGLEDMFVPAVADFSNMLSDTANKEKVQLYVSDAIHKSHIEFNENGTKAAAVTVIIMDKNMAIQPEKESINIEFNKPFLYIIKEKNKNKIWFFGTVYTPDKWTNDNKNCNVR